MQETCKITLAVAILKAYVIFIISKIDVALF